MTLPLSDLVRELREKKAAAARGPWTTETTSYRTESVLSFGERSLQMANEDAELIVTLVNNADALLSAAEELVTAQATIERLERRIGQLEHGYDEMRDIADAQAEFIEDADTRAEDAEAERDRYKTALEDVVAFVVTDAPRPGDGTVANEEPWLTFWTMARAALGLTDEPRT